MNKLTEIRVASYRGLRDLVVNDLGDINVLIGPTNTGKSSLLEAVWLAVFPDPLTHVFTNVLQARGLVGSLLSVKALFPNLDLKKSIEIHLHFLESEGAEKEEGVIGIRLPDACDANYLQLLHQRGWREEDFIMLEATAQAVQQTRSKRFQFAVRLSDASVDIGYLLPGQSIQSFSWIKGASLFLPGELISPSIFDEAYSTAYLSGNLPKLLEVLRELYPNLEAISPVKVEQDRWMTYVRLLQGSTIPLFVMGDGFKAAFVLLEYIMRQDQEEDKTKLILLDSPEVFQHRKGLEVLARSLTEAVSRWRSQVILATQSIELLDLLLEEGIQKSLALKVYRFGLVDGRPIAYPPFTLEEARTSRELIGADLRR
jgi:predicted ATP-dependent endonuclease of OLD family